MHNQYEEEYNRPLHRLVYVFGEKQLSLKVATHFANQPDIKKSKIRLKVVQELDFVIKRNKQPFMTRIFNPDKTLKSNIRLGILPLKWVNKYNEKKPCVIVICFSNKNTNLDNFVTQCEVTLNMNELYLKRNRIRVVFLMLTKFKMLSEEKNFIRNRLNIDPRNVFVTIDKDFGDIRKDFVSVLKDYSKKFYENRISKYKNNSNLGNADSAPFIEYHTRNMLKTAFFYSAINSSDRALRYFERAYENCLRLLRLYSARAQKFISGVKSDSGQNKASLLDEAKDPRHVSFVTRFYDFQKCEEAARLANLVCVQMAFLKFTKNQIFNYQIVREVVAHMDRLRLVPVWGTTFLRKFDVKTLVHLFRLAFSFGRRTFKTDLLTNVLILFDFFKTLVSLSNKFLDFHFGPGNKIVSNLKNSVGWSHFSRFSLESDSLKIQLKQISLGACFKILGANKTQLPGDVHQGDPLQVDSQSPEKGSEEINRGPSELYYYREPKVQKFYGLDIDDQVRLSSKADVMASNLANLEKFIMKENDLNYFINLFDDLNDFLINQFMPHSGLENSKRVARFYLVVLFENIIRNGSPVFLDTFRNAHRFASALDLNRCNWTSFQEQIQNMFPIGESQDQELPRKNFEVNTLAKALLSSHSKSVTGLKMANTPKFLLLRELYDCLKVKYLADNLKKRWEMLWRFMSYVPDYFRIQQNKKLNCRYSDLVHSNMECLLSNANDVKEMRLKGGLNPSVLRRAVSEDSIRQKVLLSIERGAQGGFSGGWVPDHDLVFDVEVHSCLRRTKGLSQTGSENKTLEIKVFRDEVTILSCFKSAVYGKFDRVQVDLHLVLRNYFGFKLFDRVDVRFSDDSHNFSMNKDEIEMDMVEQHGSHGRRNQTSRN